METTPLLGEDDESRLNIRNLVMGNIVVVLYHISSYFHSPTLSQYLYKRVTLEVFGNHSGDSTNPANITCYSNRTSEDYILQERAQILTSRQAMYFSLVSYSATLLGVLVLGSYSDFIGRKMLFILPALGDMLRDVILCVIIHWELDLSWYFIGEFMGGIFSSSQGILLAGYAYAADNTPPNKSRTIAIAMIDTSRYLATAATYTATGFFIQDMGYFYPSIVSASVMLILILTTVFFVKEAPHINKQAKSTKVTTVRALRNVVGLYIFDRTCKIRSLFWLDFFSYLFFQFSTSGISNINILFMLNLPFCWTPEMIGYFSTAMTLLQQLFGIPLIKLMHYCAGDEVTGVVSSITVIASDVIHGLASTNWMMYGYAIAASLSFVVPPVIRAIMSRMTPRERQGSLFTSLTLADIITGIIGTPGFAIIYQTTVDFMRGLVFLVFAGTHVVSTVLLMVFACMSYRHTRSIQQEVAVTIQDRERATGIQQPE